MPDADLTNYIVGLPVGTKNWAAAAEAETIEAIDVDDLPGGIVTGSNLIEFSGDIPPKLRSAVPLSLLAAQRVAANDTAIRTPDQWIERHNTVLRNLNWLVEGGGTLDATFDNVKVAVHEAIIPFLTAALGPAATAASIIIAALNSLKDMKEDDPWITLFDRESRRFQVTEYQFSYVSSEDGDTVVRMVAARLDAKFGRTQVLFFKVSQDTALFKTVSAAIRAPVALLSDIEDPLRAKLGGMARDFIRSLDVG